MENLWEKTNTRLVTLENLFSHIIPDRLPLMLAGTTCSNVNGKESLDVLECEKTPNGLYCQISVRSQVKTEIMQRFEKINYNGIELSLPFENAILVKVHGKSWGLLKCHYDEFTTTDLDEFADCDFINFNNPCTEAILDKKINPILKNCNFTYNTPHIAKLTAEGTLIQGKFTSIKEIEPKTMKTLTILTQKPPFFITTNAWLMVSDESKEQIIKPEKIYDERIISTTWLTDTDIADLEHSTRLFHIVESADSGNIIDLVMGVILLIMAPSTVYFCKLCLDGTRWAKMCCRKETPIARPLKRQNFDKNKKALLT